MKLTVSDIQERVAKTEERRFQYKKMALEWEDAWALHAFDRTPRQAIEQDGHEQVTLPIPFNVINLAQRLISTTPKIDVPPAQAEEDADKKAELCERWLTAAWQKINRDQNRNIIADCTWWILVRGRFVLETKWIADVLPKKLRKRRFPVLMRTLDPLNCGFKYGPGYLEYAFHKYEDDYLNVLQRYPDLKLKKPKAKKRFDNEDDEVEVTDFWWIDFEDGSVWNAVIVDEEFAKEPAQTNYPEIPLFEGYGDSAPLADESYRGLSLLHPITATGLWRYQCRLASQMATGLLWYFWPPITVMNENGQAIDDIKVGPGITTTLPMGTVVNVLKSEPNIPLAQNTASMIDAEVQNSTFPGVMYGKAPGELQAGYGVSLLADSAKGRIKAFLEALEFGIARASEMVLALVAEFGDSKGVDVWGMDERSGSAYRLTLKPKDLDGLDEVSISLKPVVPTDETQKQATGLRLVQDGIVSRQTFRDKWLGITVPTDEQRRIQLEMVMQRPDLQERLGDKVLEEYFGEDWRDRLGLPPPQPPPPPEPPPGMMPPPPMMGPPPPAPPPIQPEGIGTAVGGGIPPEIGGQLTPEAMGLPANLDPAMFAEMTGQPLPPGEELALMQGLPR